MTAITAPLAPVNMDSKSLLEKAESCYRFGKFSDAYRDCKSALESDEFSSWKDKKKHDAVKSFIRYGYHSNGKTEVLKWLQKRRDVLPDYPLHVCEWVAAEMSNVSKKRLKYARNDVLTASEKALREIIDEASSTAKVNDMCMDVLVQRVMIPHEKLKDAEDAIRQFSPKLSTECKTDLQHALQRERAAADKAAAAHPSKRAWRSTLPPLRPPSTAAAPPGPAAHSAPAWLPQAAPGTLMDRVVRGLQAAFTQEGLTRLIVPAVTGMVVVWLLGPKERPKSDAVAVADSRLDF